MIKNELVHVKAVHIPAHDEHDDVTYCDKCGEKISKYTDSPLRIRQYDDYEFYKERKYEYYSGFDLCKDCVSNYLIPLLSADLKKEANEYEEEYEY